ncbi:2'-5' RNA ligase family protein [Flavobacterium terrigena]|uniref:2'-5' RNA ligase n=1 Tax=Flavobacterium terrigena TaxID=402734 RepID=A0A1H6QUI5_9FLAO|nr:2'-5' RNA ligase family protein [Flavobacterium terrigena]SEI42925.1 2'-5' RNA ligase [Flavobacterium terrigena]
MLHRYSIAINPSLELITTIKNMKEQLATEVGWFNSKNSIAHITICEFESSERDLERIKKQLERICDTITPVPVKLDDFGTFPNGAFYIAPDTDSKEALQPVMKSFHNALLVKTFHHSDTPHISIARKLTPENLIKASQLFTSINESFLCNGIVLRMLDMQLKQFRVIDAFEFKGLPKEVQGSLF